MADLFCLLSNIVHNSLLFGIILIGFGLLITIHECGHFLFAKLFGIATPTFSIGMGPKIFQKKIFGTDFCLSLLPIGGYVEIATKPEIDSPALPYGSYFNDKPYWQKLCVMLGGIAFNLITSFLIYFAVFAHGKPIIYVDSILINEVLPGTPADKAKLLKGDIITALDNQKLSSIKNFSLSKLLPATKTKMVIEIKRKNLLKKITINLPEASNTPRIGIQYSPVSFSVSEQKMSLSEAMKSAFKTTKETIHGTVHAIKSMFTQRSLKNAGGPVMIFSESFKMAQQGFKALLLFLAFISINLAILNFLPLGALDGGQMLFVTIEWIIRRELPDMIKIAINLGSFALFIALSLYLTFNDILRIFFS